MPTYSVILTALVPVFLVIGFGYFAVWRKLFSQETVEGLMHFAQNFAVPCLLFLAISRIDLKADFNIPLLVSFYTGALGAFVLGYLGARHFFGREIEDGHGTRELDSAICRFGQRRDPVGQLSR